MLAKIGINRIKSYIELYDLNGRIIMTDDLIKFTRGVPPPESFPKEKLAKCANKVLAENSDIILQYGDSRGYAPLRQLIAGERGISEDRIILGQGSLQMVDLCARVMLSPGDLVYIESPSYDRTMTVLKRAGARIVGFALEDDGPDINEIELRLKGGERPLFFYLIPDFQNPSGTVLSTSKRIHLARLAQEYKFWILEDIPYRKLRYRNQELPSLFDLAPDRVMQLSSYSKLICPGLRVGFISTAEAVSDRLAKFAEDTYINSSYFTQAMVFDFIQCGWQEEHLIFLKDLYRSRLDAMLNALDTDFNDLATWHKPDGGFFIGMTLKTKIRTEDLMKRAQEFNLELSDGRGFFTSGGDGFIRLPFCALTPDEIHTGISRLNKVIRSLI
jgi:2-aminoadipate transaminase